MKNKKIIYILLPAALIIWGLIIAKIIIRVKQPGKECKVSNTAIQSEPGIQQSDTITLIANYRDPFLSSFNKQYEPVRKTEIPQERAFKPKREPVRNIQWPEIIYNGTITNNRNDQNTALVRMEQQDLLIHKGDFIKGITFTEVYTDSLKVKYQNELKTIIRKY
jgi:hypothetical protein